jgi:hypothetical protein
MVSNPSANTSLRTIMAIWILVFLRIFYLWILILKNPIKLLLISTKSSLADQPNATKINQMWRCTHPHEPPKASANHATSLDALVPSSFSVRVV